LTKETQAPKIYSVSELTKKIQNALEERFDVLWLEGEISNFSAPVSGHYYMALKDERAQIRAVMFRSQAHHLMFLPKNGMKILARGRLGLYAPRGEYQIILDYIEPMGVGALALAFEQLKKKLAAQGVFDKAIKKPLPFLPQYVAVISSPTGAAIRDFLKVIGRRFANMEIILIPVRVQGDEAVSDMVEALDLVNRELKVDVIVLTRGGGSLEDLWAFNHEDLALAIRRSKIPVVSAVGHEIDITISDLAADFRAPTPSAAAELLVAEKATLVNRLDEIKARLISGIMNNIRYGAQRLAHLIRLLKDPKKRIAESWMRLDEKHSRLIKTIYSAISDKQKDLDHEQRSLLANSPVVRIKSMGQKIDFHKHALVTSMENCLKGMRSPLSLLEKRLTDLSPLSVLKRGYSITRRLPEKTVIRDCFTLNKGDRVQVLLSEGEIECRVEKITGEQTKI